MAASVNDTCDNHFKWYTKKLYPLNKRSLPQKWNNKDKYETLKLSSNNLRVTYNGPGKSHREAGSCRADCHIPPSCGIYYFEVTLISKGRDGFFGVGLAQEKVNLNRLPGWDHGSYGYHADDGHVFNASVTGHAYGPTFGAGDVVGCGVDFFENTCFYTKNGICLGTAFTQIPSFVFPVVGLQTPGEELEANFGQRPFLYDIEAHIVQARCKARRIVQKAALYRSNLQNKEWQSVMQTLVSAYLVHRGYSASAELFTQNTHLPMNNAIRNVRQRQNILGLIMTGRIGEAIKLTNEFFPNLIDNQPHLLFQLKCRQFIEMIVGCDSEVDALIELSDHPQTVHDGRSVFYSSKHSDLDLSTVNTGMIHITKSNDCHDGDKHPEKMDCTESSSQCSSSLGRILKFGRELHSFSLQLQRKGLFEQRQRAQLHEAFSLLAYSEPSACPVAHLFSSTHREVVASALNRAILVSEGIEPVPALTTCLAHTERCLEILDTDANCGASAFLALRTLAANREFSELLQHGGKFNGASFSTLSKHQTE